MPGDSNDLVLKQILEKIELPERAYETAEKRYQDIGEWFHRPESTCVDLDPQVFPQGSFRLGTAIRPDKDEEYDLDMGCNLRQGLSKDVCTQKQLKALVGDELERYRIARNIKDDLAEKQRCWRLDYADELSFHMDIVPCIPESDSERTTLKDTIVASTELNSDLATEVSELALSITDNMDELYGYTTRSWRISNPEGYAQWFESRMRLASSVLAQREIDFKASIDALPFYKWKTPLQIAIQLLKRHRDTMFKGNEDSKPISIIITTLASRAYKGESDLVSALSNILHSMGTYIHPQAPHVPNPVNPVEDFADKWYSQKHEHLKLKENFYRWLLQAQADFAAICSKESSQVILDAAEHGFSVSLDKSSIERSLGLSAPIVTPAKKIAATDPRPWFKL